MTAKGIRAHMDDSGPWEGAFSPASQSAVLINIQRVMSYFRSKLQGQRYGHGALGLPACCFLHPSQPTLTFYLFTCFSRQHKACTGWSFPLLAVGLTSPIRLSNSWGQRPDFILICCSTHSSKSHPWWCWWRGEGSCRVDEFWCHWIWWASLCFGSSLQIPQTAWSVHAPTGSNLPSSNETWKWDSSITGKKLDLSRWP